MSSSSEPGAGPGGRPAPGAPAVSVIVTAHNAAATIARSLECILAQDLPDPFEVIVVDNGSSDRTGELAAAAAGPVTLLCCRRQGPGAARNAAAARARAPVLAFTDPDCYPTPGWLRAGLASLRGHEIVQGAIRADRRARPGPYDRTLWLLEDRGLYQTANLIMRREAFERCGGFSEWIDPDADARGPFGEDVDLVWRARRQGAQVAFAPRALVEHAVFPRSAAAYVAERRRLTLFSELARRVPELRRELFFAGLFHSARSAGFDLALAGLLAAALRRDPRPLLAAAPYGLRLALLARRQPRRAAVELAADAVGCMSLLEGSIRARTPLL